MRPGSINQVMRAATTTAVERRITEEIGTAGGKILPPRTDQPLLEVILIHVEVAVDADDQRAGLTGNSGETEAGRLGCTAPPD